MSDSTQPGRAHPLGASWDGEGVNFALDAPRASSVELCLFGEPGDVEPSRCLPLPERSGTVWHGRVPGLIPGQTYAFRVDGPSRRHDPRLLLLDPQARAHTDERRSPAPRSVVVGTNFAWGGDRPPRTAWSDTLIYECHVQGMTARHPEVDESQRGTYLGLCSEPLLEHFVSLGVTAVELMPVLHFGNERRLARLGLSNYWGYSPIGLLAPHSLYASDCLGQQVTEFQEMVRTFHGRGIEVILDVCYGHTVEGDGGPPRSLAGIDAEAYYRLRADGAERFVDWTGCGNTLDLRRPTALRLVLDSLRFWVQEMHVDGFRFDQAVVLGRGEEAFEPQGSFFATLAQDPVLAGVKQIAEPWDLGPDGYQLGAFPPGWSEWNDRFRRDVRSFWRGDAGRLGELASRLAGSSDVFGSSRPGPQDGINYVSCHDGFTLTDVVSYESKHNEGNGEDGRDGNDDNRSRNWGVEGPTDAPGVSHLRECARRAMLATLAFSQGVPMLSHGDEIGRTQQGNNNAYCHSGELTWVDWDLDRERRSLLDFTREVFRIRREHPVLRRRSFFDGLPAGEGGEKDLVWLRPEGGEMEAAHWSEPEARTLGMLVHGHAADPVDAATLLLLVNAGDDESCFSAPRLSTGGDWIELLRSWSDPPRASEEGVVFVESHGLVLLQWRGP